MTRSSLQSSGQKNVGLLTIVFVLTLALSSAPRAVSATLPPSNGTTPATEWVPAGPASDNIRYQFYVNDADELSAMCVGQAPSCVPALDLSDVPIGGNDLSQASGCVPSPTHVCATDDPRFWVTSPTIQQGQLEL